MFRQVNLMARNDEGPMNPYAAPEAPLEAAPAPMIQGLEEKEAIRRRFLKHEASVKSIGSLYILGGVFYLLATVVIAIASFNGAREGSIPGAVAIGVFGSVSLTLGLGLTSLRSWARWIVTALTAISFLSILILLASVLFQVMMTGGFVSNGPRFTGVLIAYGFGLFIIGYILYLLISPKGSMVFSHEYREVMAATPHIKYKTSCILKGFLILLIAVILVGVISAFLDNFIRNR